MHVHVHMQIIPNLKYIVIREECSHILVNSCTDNVCQSSLLTALYCEPLKWVCTDLSKGSYHESKQPLER